MDFSNLFNGFFNPSMGGMNLGFPEEDRQLTEIVHSIATQEISKYEDTKEDKEYVGGYDSDESDDGGDRAFDEKVEISRRNLGKILELFEKANSARSEFLENFPDWRVLREETIRRLEEIAQSIQKDKFWCNVGKIAGGTVGVAGAAAIAGSLLFPPAAVAVIPAWLGGAATAAFLPSFLLPAAAPVVSTLAVGGGIAVGGGGVAMVGAKVTEMELIRSNMEDAKNALESDKLSFSYMENWFKHCKELTDALEAVIGFNIIDQFMEELRISFAKLENISKLVKSSKHIWLKAVVKLCVRRFLANGAIVLKFGLCLGAIVVTFLFVVFLLHKRNRFLFNCAMVTKHLIHQLHFNPDIGELAGMISAVSIGGAAAVDCIPAAIAQKLALGAFAGAGAAINLGIIVLTAIDIKEGSTCKQREDVKKAAEKLQEEFVFLQEVYANLSTECGGSSSLGKTISFFDNAQKNSIQFIANSPD